MLSSDNAGPKELTGQTETWISFSDNLISYILVNTVPQDTQDTEELYFKKN